jgi:hypothetical protein
MTPKRIAFLSDDYFELANALPEVSTAFALGEKIIVLADGRAYEVVGSDEDADAIVIPEILSEDDEIGSVPQVPLDVEEEPFEENQPVSSFCPGAGSALGLMGIVIGGVRKRD